MLCAFTLLTAVTLALMMKIIEGPVYYAIPIGGNKLNDYRDLSNCIWNMFVTMTTGK